MAQATNAQLIKEADLAFENMSDGAKLPEDRAKEFYQMTREQAKLKDYVDIVPINASGELLMPWLEAPTNVMGLAQGLKNPADYNFAQFNQGDEKLETIDFETMVFIPNKWKNANIQGQTGVDVALSLLTQQFAANAEQAGLYSNVLGPAIKESEVKRNGSTTNYVKFNARSKSNGWLERMENGVVVDAQDSNDIYGVMGDALLGWGDRYEKFSEQIRWGLPPYLHKIMQINLARSRETAFGDAAINTKVNLTPYGIEALQLPLLTVRPPEVEHITLSGTTPVALQYKPLKKAEAVVLPSNLADVATAPYVEGAGQDYVMNEVNGTIARDAAGDIDSGDVVKVQYQTGTKLFLAPPKNLVLGIGNDMSITRWDYPPGNGVFYFIRGTLGFGVRDPKALLLIKNLKATRQTG